MNNTQNKGFTLIELLVVIAIIGILSGIIIVSMGNSQKAAHDAQIKEVMSQMRTAAQVYSISHSNYGANAAIVSSTDCVTNLGSTVGADADFLKLCNSILGYAPLVTVEANGTAWCAETVLQVSGAGTWCVDSVGYSGTTANCSATVSACQ
ncbi:MAG: prepilin-type N-terminal cleavage/methylation domain-containing protein [Candidatus Pacebacteria bacterium]|nr:prepilin-type N-terminal cleavage/methylation domain-containing protein [Candidatus Paceibacterota bacterium]